MFVRNSRALTPIPFCAGVTFMPKDRGGIGRVGKKHLNVSIFDKHRELKYKVTKLKLVCIGGEEAAAAGDGDEGAGRGAEGRRRCGVDGGEGWVRGRGVRGGRAGKGRGRGGCRCRWVCALLLLKRFWESGGSR